MSMSGWKWNKNLNKMGKVATICDHGISRNEVKALTRHARTLKQKN